MIHYPSVQLEYSISHGDVKIRQIFRIMSNGTLAPRDDERSHQHRNGKGKIYDQITYRSAGIP